MLCVPVTLPHVFASFTPADWVTSFSGGLCRHPPGIPISALLPRLGLQSEAWAPGGGQEEVHCCCICRTTTAPEMASATHKPPPPSAPCWCAQELPTSQADAGLGYWLRGAGRSPAGPGASGSAQGLRSVFHLRTGVCGPWVPGAAPLPPASTQGCITQDSPGQESQQFETHPYV